MKNLLEVNHFGGLLVFFLIRCSYLLIEDMSKYQIASESKI